MAFLLLFSSKTILNELFPDQIAFYKLLCSMVITFQLIANNNMDDIETNALIL